MALLVLLPVAVRVALFSSWRFREDMFTTAWLSATHDFLGRSFFRLIPDNRLDWLAEFPTPFFALQRPFLELLGTTVFAVNLSVQPWVALTAVLLYLAVRDALDRLSAAIAVVIYSFLAPAVYLETQGFHFVSSTAAFLAFYWLLQRFLRDGRPLDAARTGVAAGACYLSYHSSWLALPILVLFTVLAALARRDASLLRRLPVAFAGILLVLGPFAAHAAGTGRLAGPLRRVEEVSLLRESEPVGAEDGTRVRSAPTVVGENLVKAAKELFGNRIDGHGGYDFGRRPPFDRVTLTLLLGSALLGLAVFSFRGDVLRILGVVAIAFVSLVGLSTPPPAFHRFSVAFPFVAAVLALPFTALSRLRYRPILPRALAGAGLLALLALSNVAHVVDAIARDADYDELRISELLSARFPGLRLQVAAFPSFAFERVYPFSVRPTIERIETDYHDSLLGRFRPADDLVVLIHAPHEVPPGRKEFQQEFADLDPEARLWPLGPKYSLLARRGGLPQKH